MNKDRYSIAVLDKSLEDKYSVSLMNSVISTVSTFRLI